MRTPNPHEISKATTTSLNLSNKSNSDPPDLINNIRIPFLRLSLRLLSFDLRLRPLNLLDQKLHPLISPRTIRQMRRQHHQLPATNSITSLTNYLDLISRKVWDLIAILLLLRIAVEYHTRDLILDSGIEFLNGPMVDGSALGVAACHDDRVWAFLGHGVEGVLHEFLGSGVGAARDGVGADCGGVVDTFGRYGGVTKFLLEAV